MATVKQLVDAFSKVMRAPAGRVNQVARRLIDQGVLPISRGRRIAEVSDNHVAALIFAFYATETVNEAPRAADMLLKGRAGATIDDVVATIVGSGDGLVIDATMMVIVPWCDRDLSLSSDRPHKLTLIPSECLEELRLALSQPVLAQEGV